MRFLTRGGWGLLLTFVGVSSACDSAPSCGDGVVDSGEACDDGNLASNDGCSAVCQPDDDSRTPGDDRAFYFGCGETPEARVTCGPGTVCCLTDGPSCASVAQGCLDVFNVVSCDGPEDCAAGSHCERLTHGVACNSSEVSGTFCHRDADCVPPSPWLKDGTCNPSGLCDFVVIPPEEVEL